MHFEITNLVRIMYGKVCCNWKALCNSLKSRFINKLSSPGCGERCPQGAQLEMPQEGAKKVEIYEVLTAQSSFLTARARSF